MEQINKEELMMINGLCCCYDLLYCIMPDCYGCASKCELACIGSEFCLKAGAKPLWCSSEDESRTCTLGCGILNCYVKSPTSCCKSSSQLLCYIASCAIPCDDQPCDVGFCCIFCHPTCKCCATYASVNEDEVVSTQKKPLGKNGK